MEGAVAGALYAAENIIEGAVALAKGLTHPTLPLKANLTHITSVPVPRSHHTLSVVKGRAYIFGGQDQTGQLADNAMHIVILPSSGVLEADYKSVPARALQPGGEVPRARKGHTAVVIGDSIYLFGGEGQGVEEEKGRVWVYRTVSNSWSYLDPAEGSTAPLPRSGHSAASSELPGPKDEVVYREKAPQQPADPAKVVPEPAEVDTWGTMFVVGGKSTTNGEASTDALAFDVRTRTWSNIPSPSGQPRSDASLTLAGNWLFRFGGKSATELDIGTGFELLDVGPVFTHAEGGTTPLTSGWGWQEVLPADGSETPQPRSGAGLAPVTTGQGRHYLLALGGEAQNGSLLGDIWAFQLPSEKTTAAKAKDETRATMKAGTNESKWAESQYIYIDSKGEEESQIAGQSKQGISSRCHFAVARGTEVDGASVVAWGGVDGEGKVLGDGWLVTVDR
ncbi:hypothetical protein EJ04DRAFT_222949 [Polyplosphaeria fusca]|uniref:Galactose oxidase n=1 Tax=Polyplosphaeria fusca TaxID=682080 RepID=A0A9P4R1H3_9PLEO|nr:hypothetical protein EJ04DRAFT_222949 [Polyplosphaeria fusca]